jgi:hypothetical protein
LPLKGAASQIGNFLCCSLQSWFCQCLFHNIDCRGVASIGLIDSGFHFELKLYSSITKVYEVSSLEQGLRLFNLDIIREGGAGNRYYVIDINYFPGKDF